MRGTNTFYYLELIQVSLVCDCCLTGFVARIPQRVPPVEHELLTLSSGAPEYPRFLVGFVSLDLQFSLQFFVDRCFLFFLLTIVLYVLHRFTTSDYPFGIFKLFSEMMIPQLIYVVCLTQQHIPIVVFGVTDQCTLEAVTSGQELISKNVTTVGQERIPFRCTLFYCQTVAF